MKHFMLTLSVKICNYFVVRILFSTIFTQTAHMGNTNLVVILVVYTGWAKNWTIFFENDTRRRQAGKKLRWCPYIAQTW